VINKWAVNWCVGPLVVDDIVLTKESVQGREYGPRYKGIGVEAGEIFRSGTSSVGVNPRRCHFKCTDHI
jgi:hypothetical protein